MQMLGGWGAEPPLEEGEPAGPCDRLADSFSGPASATVAALAGLQPCDGEPSGRCSRGSAAQGSDASWLSADGSLSAAEAAAAYAAQQVEGAEAAVAAAASEAGEGSEDGCTAMATEPAAVVPLVEDAGCSPQPSPRAVEDAAAAAAGANADAAAAAADSEGDWTVVSGEQSDEEAAEEAGGGSGAEPMVA